MDIKEITTSAGHMAAARSKVMRALFDRSKKKPLVDSFEGVGVHQFL